MTIYRTGDTILNTDKAIQSWSEDTWFDGSNLVSVPTGSPRAHERLYKSSKGRYYIEWWTNQQGVRSHAELITPKKAALWLRENAHSLPDDLVSIGNEIEE